MTLIATRQPAVLAMVAHELRGPIAALQLASELLDRDLDQLDWLQVKTMVSSIHRRALRLRGLTENLLWAATTTDGHLRIARGAVDLRDLAADVGALVEPLLDRKNQRLRVRARGPIPLVGGDEFRLNQVLLNLILNASKYSDAGTRIDVIATFRAGKARVTVADRGPGIAPGDANRLFQAYERAGRTGGDGLGIGLSVVRSIIEAHGGDVGFASRRRGGAMFWFELPVERVDDAEALRASMTRMEMVG